MKIRQADFAGLQVDIATVGRGVRFTIHPKQSGGSVTALAPVANSCRSCVVAVNGDFFNESTREPIGGVISNGVVLRSPNPRQNQLTIAPSGHISAGPMEWTGEITARDGTRLPVAINDPAAGTPVFYDGRFGAPTPGGGALELAFAPRQSIGLRLGHALRFRLVGPHRAGQPVPAGQVVLSASGSYAAQLAELRRKFRSGAIAPTITARLATNPPARDSLGANHILVAGGHIVPIGESDQFVFGSHPRTLFGWDAHGRITLMTVGSADPGTRGGVSLPTAARLLLGMGVTNAVNLDGGGSSTFVTHGRVLNNPSDGSARHVANAWVVVRTRSSARAGRAVRHPGARIRRAPVVHRPAVATQGVRPRVAGGSAPSPAPTDPGPGATRAPSTPRAPVRRAAEQPIAAAPLASPHAPGARSSEVGAALRVAVVMVPVLLLVPDWAQPVVLLAILAGFALCVAGRRKRRGSVRRGPESRVASGPPM